MIFFSQDPIEDVRVQECRPKVPKEEEEEEEMEEMGDLEEEMVEGEKEATGLILQNGM